MTSKSASPHRRRFRCPRSLSRVMPTVHLHTSTPLAYAKKFTGKYAHRLIAERRRTTTFPKRRPTSSSKAILDVPTADANRRPTSTLALPIPMSNR